MPITRREFIGKGIMVAAGVRFLPPIVFRAGPAFGQTSPDPASAQRNRMIVIFQQGGNDGLNMVMPRGDVSGAPRFSVYRKVRPDLYYEPSESLPLDLPGDADQQLGLNPRLTKIHTWYRQSRVAIVQGVDYPKHNYSHFESTDIWQSGEPEASRTSGWLGRHLDRAGIPEGELRGLGIGRELPLILRGEERQGVEVESASTRFSDGTGAVGDARHSAFARFGDHPVEEPIRHYAGRQAYHTVALIEALENVPAPARTGNYLANALLTARLLLEMDFGVECVFVWHSGGQGVGGYDTHTSQTATHERLMTDFDQAIEAFLLGSTGGTPIPGVGPLPPEIADRTLIASVSEFGRRIGQNGSGSSAGTDHGAAAPTLLIGPNPASTAAGVRLTPGLHGDHPNMGTTALPADNLGMTTELRRVYQSLLQGWLGSPDPRYEGRYEPLPGLFT